MPEPCSRGRTRNATLVRYGLSFVIPLSGDCDTEDTTATNGRGRLNTICISYALYGCALGGNLRGWRDFARVRDDPSSSPFGSSDIGRARTTRAEKKCANADKTSFKLDTQALLFQDCASR